MSAQTLRTSGVILGTFEADATGDAGEAFARARAIDERLAQHRDDRARVSRDPLLVVVDADGRRDDRAQFAALQKLASEEGARLADDAAFLAKARTRAEAWRTEMLAGSVGDDAAALQRMEYRRQFGARDEPARVTILTKALDRRQARDLPLLRALVADELTNEGLSGLLAPFRAPIETLILEVADPEGYAAWQQTSAQLDEFESAYALAFRHVSSQTDPKDAEAVRSLVFLNAPPTT